MNNFVIYHASPFVIEEFNYDSLYQSIRNHNNGALGLWCSFKNDWIKGFGENIYKIEYPSTAKEHKMPITELAKHMDKTKEEHRNIRDELIKSGIDYVSLIEMNGTCEMIIILNFDLIKIQEITYT